MTTPVEGQTVYVPPYAKESGHETATTTSLTSVEAAKADLAAANERDVSPETADEKDVAVVVDEDTKSEEPVADDDEADYLPMGPKLYLIVFSLMMAVFCVALDNTVSSAPQTTAPA
ncbi:hypothetical protein V492_05588 [Pseudogymnoascus sp. VKM F-4246]|nr:hypothetical protein V492_05588 [Pseudogymnoascus sp. VKM F-4246]